MAKQKRKVEKKKIIQALPFMLPSFIGMLIFSLCPVLIAVFLSFTDWNGLEKLNVQTFTDHFIGVDNYKTILSSSEFWTVLLHTLYYIALYIPLVFIASLGIALLLNKKKKGTMVLRVLYYIPVLTSWVAASLIWKWVLSPKYGIFNQILGIVGISGPGWLTSEVWAMPGIVLASVWKDMGFFGLFLLSGLSAIDPTYYEAAKVDGAGRIVTFFKVTLPLLTPSIFFCLIMSLINAFQLFPQVQIMTEGGPNGATQVMVERIYTYGFSYFKMGYASAYSWLLFLIIFVLTMIQMKLQNGWVHYES
ncbi:MAG: sugar ABC transporter permease [Clostridiales bacterium]|nr:sugar ABC transporter permease [Roseburia sp.]MDD7636725.1 sugar ABC transporter permease [Clostridiales bacterium]MDY4111706.1 sugar ABC transporter permease [Roseburia sp.]